MGDGGTTAPAFVGRYVRNVRRSSQYRLATYQASLKVSVLVLMTHVCSDNEVHN
jgi:hypothetical protein